MNNSKSRTDIFYFIVLILTLLIMIVGVTFTYFSLIASEKEDSTKIKTGTLAINYIDGIAIDTYALMSINEPNLSTKYSVYKKSFSVKSTGTLDQTLNISMFVTDNDFDDKALSYALYDSTGYKISKNSIPKTGDILAMANYPNYDLNQPFTPNSFLAKTYNSLSSEEKTKNQDYEMGNTFKGGFNIDASQIKYQ